MHVLSRIKHQLFREQVTEDRSSTLYWQQQIYTVISSLVIGAGTILLLLGVIQSYTITNMVMLYFFVIAYAFALVIVFARRMPFKIRIYSLISLTFSTGIMLVITAGPKGSSCSYITSSFILAALLLDRRGIFYHSAVSVTAFALITIALSTDLFASQPISEMQDAWAFFVSSSLLIGAVQAIIVHMITDGLQKQTEQVQRQKNDMIAVLPPSSNRC